MQQNIDITKRLTVKCTLQHMKEDCNSSRLKLEDSSF